MHASVRIIQTSCDVRGAIVFTRNQCSRVMQGKNKKKKKITYLLSATCCVRVLFYYSALHYIYPIYITNLCRRTHSINILRSNTFVFKSFDCILITILSRCVIEHRLLDRSISSLIKLIIGLSDGTLCVARTTLAINKPQ